MDNNTLHRRILTHVIITVFFALFGGIYEIFSHGVYSFFMIYAFAAPLCLCVLPYAVLLLKGKTPAKMAAELWDAAVLTLTAGLVFCGVLEIYGTTSRLTAVYFIAAAILALAAVVSGLIFSRARV
jgi:hypothetical protein